MIVLIADARSRFELHAGNFASDCTEILYADDTLIIDERGSLASAYMQCILAEGIDMDWPLIGIRSK